jgi:hypothetical protein
MIEFLFLLSLVANGILVWYVRKLIKNLTFGVDNVDSFQKMLNEYASTLEAITEMEKFYADETLTIAANNTRMVIAACKVYKKSIIDSEEDLQDNELEQP